MVFVGIIGVVLNAISIACNDSVTVRVSAAVATALWGVLIGIHLITRGIIVL